MAVRSIRFVLYAVAILLSAGEAFASERPPGVNEDPALLGRLALEGDAAAMVRLGLVYRDAGLPKEAADWFCAAARAGHAAGSYWCGRAHLLGLGRLRDPGGGLRMLEDGARSGDSAAALLLAEHSPAPADEEWYALAARYGSPEGDFRLGLLAERRGRRVAARAALSRAATAGHAGAMNALALWLLNDPARTAEDVTQALSLLGVAAQAGDQTAQFNLGESRAAEDVHAAYRLFAQAAAGANPGLRAVAEDRMRALEAQIGSEAASGIRADIARMLVTRSGSAPHPSGEPD